MTTRLFRTVLGAALLAMTLFLVGCGPELGPIARVTTMASPSLPETSDPSVVRVGREYFVYGSNSHVRAPVMRTDDLSRSYTLAQKNALVSNAMPSKPAWAVRSDQLWAPTVGKFGNSWVMFFSADRASGYVNDNRQCIGRATASSPMGPFVAEPTPFHCGLNWTGGALDPQIFVAPNGKAYLHAAFGNTESPIYVIPLSASGGRAGSATAILSRQHSWEYHFIEQPAMVYDTVRRNYLLTYSAGRWWEARYSTGIARCSSPTGPCTSDPNGPWLASSGGRTGPGGLSFFTNTAGQPQAIFSTFPRGGETTNGNRSATIMPLTLSPAVGLGRVTK